ncbi:hypothetical protein [Devosia sediminis]|uniref:Uncharacterized protein n=1 Tax=Devosia sediminis TaxID=2798801 RepID=A0A934INF4_9HYPH|nr:hypothetical protein [Devosia sediminis]MBJ3783908.1 hypothetical protein [Devosia sediminis]
MVLNLAVEPVSSGATQTADYRYRPAMGERTVLPEGPQKSAAGAKPGDRESLPFNKKPKADEQPPEPERNRTADFAAAVIAGALSPTPRSMEELLRRIGSAEIPQESQARLKDLLA